MTDVASSKRDVVYSSTHSAQIEDYPIADIDRDAIFTRLFDLARPYTMTSKEVMYSTYAAARYVALRGIPGDIVECGVWRGGSALLAAMTVRDYEATRPRSWFRKKPRRAWLYDTFEGMTRPTDDDVDREGVSAAHYMATYADDGRWCYADESDVRGVFARHGFDDSNARLVKGDVLETLKRYRPKQIAMLRLDTDWYESTRAELETLFPLLSRGGILIIDDYGHWEGSRRAVDEYFATRPCVLLNRVSYAVRVAVKV